MITLNTIYIMSNEIRVEVDYNGNTYLRYQNQVYNIFFDFESKNGIAISQISDSSYAELSGILEDNPHIARHAMKGKIVLSDSTLKGRVTRVLAELNSEELDKETDLNMLSAHNTTFKEEEYFRVVKMNEDDGLEDDGLEDDWDITDTEEKYWISQDLEYRFSGVKNFESHNPINVRKVMAFVPEIYFSDLLNEIPSHNDTLMISGGRDSKIIVSSVQRTDGFCTKRLIFYSDIGEIKIQFPSSHTIRLRVIKTDKELDFEFINREMD